MPPEVQTRFVADVLLLAQVHQASGHLPRTSDDRRRFAQIEVLLWRLEQPSSHRPEELETLVKRLRRLWIEEQAFARHAVCGAPSNVVRGPWRREQPARVILAPERAGAARGVA